MTRVLVADDDGATRTLLSFLLKGWGHEPVEAADGDEAWAVLQGADRPAVGLVDWSMPGLEGPELCRRAQGLAGPMPFLIMVTARVSAEALAAALEAGASDFVSKPFGEVELRARVGAAARAAEAERQLAARVAELEAALATNRKLRELIPMCAWCKAVRDDDHYWKRVEDYLSEETGRRLTHGICPKCEARVRAEQLMGNQSPG